MTYELDEALALSTTAPGRHETELSDGWSIGPAVNGGLLLSMVGRALELEIGTAGHPDPLVVSAFFLSAGTAGPTVVETETIRTGRTMATGQARVLPDRRTASRSSGSARSRRTATSAHSRPMRLSPPARRSCPRSRSASAGTPRRPGRWTGSRSCAGSTCVSTRPPPGGRSASRRGEGRCRGGSGWPTDANPTRLMLLLALDAMPPVTFELGLRGWAPTLELTAHVRARPAPGWLRVRTSTRTLTGGLLEEDAEIWDSEDRLVAQSRQLARVPRS